MSDTQAILDLIAARIPHPDLHARLDADATFTDLRLCQVDGWSIAVDIEDRLERELDWNRVNKWESVRDVLDTVAALERIAA